jgi:alkanesulfonate monooxygenase SsuD/methylene tetrahydromethanopterin reductase-like flavin-dependent oxidoreductase (luciferase family)
MSEIEASVGRMRYGFVMPFGGAADVAEHAVMAESSGWDAIFDWEAVWGDDAWVALIAAAMVTDHIRLGTMLTPIPRMRPWDLASRASSLDRLSHGRVILGAGLGALHEGWTAFEADEGRRVRVEKMDEGLSMKHFDICVEGEFYGADAGERDLKAWAEAGATWWIEGAWRLENTEAGRAELARRIQAGPPDSPR